MAANDRKGLTLLDVNESAFGKHPDFKFRGPLFMTKEDFKDMESWFLRPSECRDIAEGLRLPECLFERTLQSIASDDARSCATTPARHDADSGCKICGGATRFTFVLCCNCHHREGLERAQNCSEGLKQPSAQIGPLAKTHVCFKCKVGETISQFLLCDECLRNC